ncbi:MAG: GerMN domain-containing protein [Candidatus Coprovivens sp.]
MFINIINYGDLMIYNSSLRRFVIGTLFLFVGVLLYKYPDNLVYSEDIEDSYVKEVYLGDKNNYVSLVNVSCSNNKDKVKEVFECISNGKLHSSFVSYIPDGTKLISYSIDGSLLKLNFSKEFYNVSLENEVKLIEMLVYSFTSIDGVDEIMLFVDGKLLNYLPNSNNVLPTILDRDYGINKVIDIDSISNTVSFNVYYLGKEDEYYYIPITYVMNNDNDVVEMIVRKLKNNGINSSLLTHLTSNVDVVSYDINGGNMDVLFNKELESIMKDSLLEEEIKYMLVMSFADSFDIDVSNIEIYF